MTGRGVVKRRWPAFISLYKLVLRPSSGREKGEFIILRSGRLIELDFIKRCVKCGFVELPLILHSLAVSLLWYFFFLNLPYFLVLKLWESIRCF